MSSDEYCGLIVCKGNEYLVGMAQFGNKLRWSWSRWDAWRTRNIRDARSVAGKVGGELAAFNPITGEMMMETQRMVV